MVREGLRLLLQTAEDIEVVGEVEDGRRAVRETKRLRPDVVVLDLSMPVLNGVEAARQIAMEVPSCNVLILSFYDDEQHVEHAVEAGAAGYLTKGTCSNQLMQAIREIAKGNAFFSQAAAEGLVGQWREKFLNVSPVVARFSTLTSRQTEILKLISEGYANKQIADLLAISAKTVEKHRQELMNKLNLHNIAALTRYAVSSGVVDTTVRPNWQGEISDAHSRRNGTLACSM
jgi:DNA-binding NarL/FixJ family response regulator